MAEFPTTVTSVQVRPTSPLTSPASTPMLAKMAATAGSVADRTESQHTSPGEEGAVLRRAVTGTQPTEINSAESEELRKRDHVSY